MESQTLRKTSKYRLKPTPAQERTLHRTLMLCRHVCNAALGEHREAWHMRGISVSYYQRKAELPGIKEAMPEYAEVHSQVLQDVALRVDRAFQAFFLRVKAGRHQATRALTDVTATTALPNRSTTTEPGSTMVFWCSAS
jgi:putative transposase